MEPIPHYYGDIIRKIFLVCGLLMLITLPFIKQHLVSPVFYSILAIVVLIFFAGITNPKHKGVIVCDIFVAVLGFGIFTYQAVDNSGNFFNLFFLTNLALSLLCLTAFYWGIKTVRWLWFPTKIPIVNNAEPAAPKITSASKQILSEKNEGGVANATDMNKENEVVPATLTGKAELTEEERRKKRFLSSEA